MAQTQRLIAALKRALKAQGRTYADVARGLRISEASVKRMFSAGDMPLSRLERICALMELDLADLAQSLRDPGRAPGELTAVQEEEIARDPGLLLVAVSVLNRWTAADIQAWYDLSDAELARHLAVLDRLRLIDLLPANRVRLRVAPDFRWRRDGPIQRLFLSRVVGEFFASRFAGATERLLVANAMLTDAGNAMVQRRMQALVQAFNEMNADEAHLALDERYGTTLVLALRRWEYGAFASRKRRVRGQS
ncbi:MAG: helix-turn-helix domain-containing protein [Gammaproteobacteria bacterium]